MLGLEAHYLGDHWIVSLDYRRALTGPAGDLEIVVVRFFR
jgi:hypothetical protein